MKLAERIWLYQRSSSRRSPPRRTASTKGSHAMVIIEFDEGEDCKPEVGAQALTELLEFLTALEQAGIIRNLYTTTDEIEAELEAIEAAQQAEQAAREPASA
jgi:hypothetical protein